MDSTINKKTSRRLIAIILALVWMSFAVTSTAQPTCVAANSGSAWQNRSFTSQTGAFTAKFDVTPSASPINAVVGLSKGSQTSYTGFAALVRFNPSGQIDARNGGAYAAASTIPYSANITYHFRLVVNVPAHTYSIFVAPSAGAEQLVGSNYAFRTEQNTVTNLNSWGAFLNASNPGSMQICNFAVSPSSAGFIHPGVLVNRDQLDFIKAKINANAQPWKAAFDKAVSSQWASLSWTPKPREIVECGPSSNPNLGCSDERNDAEAAYTHALLWYFTGNEAYARKSIEIMNAWARTVRDHTNHNAPLQTGWAGSLFAPAGEIIRHTYNGWAAADVERYRVMLRDVYLPEVLKVSCSNGNWELIMTDASIGISVFLDDKASFDKAVTMWRNRVPAYMYQTADGPFPVPPPPQCGKDTQAEIISFWHGQDTFVNGLAQETCRDFGHTEWGIAAAINTAETARQQGLDLYAEESKRIRDALEFHADYILGKPAPSWLCNGSINLGTIPFWEIAYNHFRNRLGFSLPLTKRVIEERVRPTGVNYFIAWETLTHAEIGWTGVP